jgi:hypothetical protein
MSWNELPGSAKAECTVYGVLAVAALIGTQTVLVEAIRGGVTGAQTWAALTGTPIVLFTSIDLFAVFLVALVFMVVEGRKIRLRWWLIYPLLSAGIGVSFGFPLFLIARRLRLGA